MTTRVIKLPNGCMKVVGPDGYAVVFGPGKSNLRQPLTEQAKLILEHCQPHVCKEGECTGDHEDDVLEFSADIFVDACTMTKKRYDGTPEAPD